MINNAVQRSNQILENLSLSLSQNDSSYIREALQRYRDDRVTPSIEDFISDSHDIIRRLLPSETYKRIQSFKYGLTKEGFLLLRNVPIDATLCNTPDEELPDTFHRVSRLSESCLVGIGQIMGEVFSYKSEREGRLIHNIYPRKSKQTVASSEGSSVHLHLHTEDIHLFPYFPSYVLFLCLRGEPHQRVHTYILRAEDIIQKLDEEVVEVLSEPRFYHEPPPVFGDRSMRSDLMPILQVIDKGVQIGVELNDTKGSCPESRRALKQLIEICNKSENLIKVCLEPGDLLILDNRKVLHGREPFHSSFSTSKRWCQRVIVKSGDLWEWREVMAGTRLLNL